MYHVADESEYEITAKLDFIVPLKQVGLITRGVLEAIHTFYAPRRIIIISSKVEGNIVRALSPHWNAGTIEFIDEETFFERNYGLSIQRILSEYDGKREGDQREPGWWIQQLIKLGAATQIPNISTHYVVWDGDLVPTRRWKLAQRDRNGVVRYYIAVLQAEARSEFNSYQYAMCMKALTGDTPRDPQGGGTFVAHHMVFNKHYVVEMLSHMSKFTGSKLPWPLLIMSSSRRFYRFSEYKTYATYMLNRHPAEFLYHPLSQYGEGGLRFRDANRIVEQMLASCPLNKGGLSYAQVREFAHLHMAEFQGRVSTAQTTALDGRQEQAYAVPGYIQLDHVYGIAKLGLDPEALPVYTHTTQQEASIPHIPIAAPSASTSATTGTAESCTAETVVIAIDLVTPPTSLPAPGLTMPDTSMTASSEFKRTRLRVTTKGARNREAMSSRGSADGSATTASTSVPVSPSSKIAAAKVSPSAFKAKNNNSSSSAQPSRMSGVLPLMTDSALASCDAKDEPASLSCHRYSASDPTLLQHGLQSTHLSAPVVPTVTCGPALSVPPSQSGWSQFNSNSRMQQS